MATLQPLPDWVALEHQVQTILTEQEIHGWKFDTASAWELASTLQRELRETEESLRRQHPYVAGTEFTPKRNNRTQGYVEGAPFTRLKEFNVTSRDQIAWVLQTFYQWKPTQLTTTGKPIIDETVLKEIVASGGPPIASDLMKCLDITKKLGMISEGTNAYLKLVTRHDRLHHHCSVATNTHRCAHRNPNLGQVSSDERFRRLFIPSEGLTMVGADLSGIELRMLAHYLARYDGGRYADILLNGDIHQVNADKIGISRRDVKTVTYAFLYGASAKKIGHSFDPQLSEVKAKKKGQEIKSAFVAAIDGLPELLKAVGERSKSGRIKLIDGREIAVDSPHKCLNYLLQGSAGIIAKRWMVEANKFEGYKRQLSFVHDELQFETTPDQVNDLKFYLRYAATCAGEKYKLRIRIDAESGSGDSWADTH